MSGGHEERSSQLAGKKMRGEIGNECPSTQAACPCVSERHTERKRDHFVLLFFFAFSMVSNPKFQLQFFY